MHFRRTHSRLAKTHLRWHTEHMCIILNEPSHARETRQRARRLITVDNPKLRHADGKLLVATVARVKDQAVTGAVHGL